MSIEQHMELARQLAAQCWCDEEPKHIEMNPALAEAVAKRIASWVGAAAEFSDGQAYYRGLVERCGKALGVAAYTCDDGTVVPDVLCAKVPELVGELVEELVRRLRDTVTYTQTLTLCLPEHEMIPDVQQVVRRRLGSELVTLFMLDPGVLSIKHERMEDKHVYTAKINVIKEP